MTFHAALVILDSAEKTHRIEHRHALTLECFLTALKDNAEPLGYTPLEFSKQWTRMLPDLLKHNLIRVGEPDRCGRTHLSMTVQGKGLLEYWNLNGCESHRKGRGFGANKKSRCVAPEIRARAQNNEAA
jgi:hypothetical protein